MASDDALSLLRKDEMHLVVHANESVVPMDEVPMSLAVERSGSDVAAATQENRVIALLDTLKTRDDEWIHHPRPVDDAVHQEDAPHAEERKGLIIGRGLAKMTSTKRDERQGTFAQAIAGANNASANNIEKDERQETFAHPVTGARDAPVLHTKDMRDLVIGRGIRRDTGTRRDERPETSSQDVASTGYVPAQHCPLPVMRNVEMAKMLVHLYQLPSCITYH
jgi:hypothetical protein